MCVIIVKPAGVKMPTSDIINAAFHANPHGCGFISPSTFYKGMSIKSLKKNLKQVSDDEPCIIHFRLATHGSIKRANCHPFNRGNVWFAHNGILDIRPERDMTDSETAFQNVIGFSKFAFLQGDRLKMYGDFIKQDDGCYYSNLRFMSYVGWERNYRCHSLALGY